MVKNRNLSFKKTQFDSIFKGRQSLDLRDSWNADSGNEENSTFDQLLMLPSEDVKSILHLLNRKTYIYISPTIQKEMLQINTPVIFSSDWSLFHTEIN